MKNNYAQILWMIILLFTLVGLSIGAVCYLDKVDASIDKMVYQLYGLSEEEISIVENSNN